MIEELVLKLLSEQWKVLQQGSIANEGPISHGGTRSDCSKGRRTFARLHAQRRVKFEGRWIRKSMSLGSSKCLTPKEVSKIHSQDKFLCH